MVSLGDVKRSAATLFSQGQHLAALRLYDAIVAVAPLDYDARIRVADCALNFPLHFRLGLAGQSCRTCLLGSFRTTRCRGLAALFST